MPVRRLDPVLIDRIAAGEVVERPAAVVKELTENALDAGARNVEITVDGGGRKLIRVVDDGCGMTRDDLELAVERHATSKLPDGNLDAIGTLGFRGEALPSIGSVSRLKVTSRHASEPNAWEIVVDAGAKGPVRPASGNVGTRMEVADLFHCVPARLKFLKGDRAEAAAVAETLRRIAMAYPHVRFTLRGEGMSTVEYPAEPFGEDMSLGRLARILDKGFVDNSVRIATAREDISIDGWASLPSFHRGNAASMHFTVNGRPVRDKVLLGAVKGAYGDTLPSDRYPILSLNLQCDPASVDVNVHPAKSEVRFRDAALVRGLVVSSIRNAVAAVGNKATAEIELADFSHPGPVGEPVARASWPDLGGFPPGEPRQGSMPGLAAPSVRAVSCPGSPDPSLDRPLGAPVAQVFENYILSLVDDAVIVIDQHAAHERIVYEKLKRQRDGAGVQRQALLVPDVVELDPESFVAVTDAAKDLEPLGLVVEPFGGDAVVVREIPSSLGKASPAGIVRDVADALTAGGRDALTRKLDAVLSSMACHGSIRSGRRMRIEEMDALLRSMEAEPKSLTCNHGRPTTKRLTKVQLEKLFERS